MIVRDEQQWLPECLDSALELGITDWVIADTGSTDSTKDIVAARLAHLPGTLLDLDWHGYGPARSEVLAQARGRADLILMLDADMTVHGALPDPPYADAYLVTVRDDPLEYGLPLLVSGDAPWRYKGPVHAYLHRDDTPRWTEAQSGLWVDDRRPGGWRPGKLEEDTRLLEQELERNPLDARSSFYLAQTYENLDRSHDALREYGRRILLGGYDEERFVAKLRRARLLCDHDPNAGLGACLDAWQERPRRAEPLYVAARQARRCGWHNVALMFARQAATIEQPPDRLFVEQGTYEWGIPLEHGIAEIRAGDTAEGQRILQRLERDDRVPQAHRDWITEILTEEVTACSSTSTPTT